jgi:hypothetical protein
MTALYLRPPVRSQPQINFSDEAQTCPHPELSGGKVPKLAGGRNLSRQSPQGRGAGAPSGGATRCCGVCEVTTTERTTSGPAMATTSRVSAAISRASSIL